MHKFSYQTEKSEFDENLPHSVELIVEEELDLQQITEVIENYLLNCGYVFPENTKLAITPKQSIEHKCCRDM